MTPLDQLENAVSPIERIRQASPIPSISAKVWSLRNSGELLCIDYLADDCRSSFIIMLSPDGRNRGLSRKLKKYGLEELIPFVHRGQLLVFL